MPFQDSHLGNLAVALVAKQLQLRRSTIARDPGEFGRREGRAAETQEMMVEECLIYSIDCSAIQRCREVEVGNLGTEGIVQRLDLHGVLTLSSLCGMTTFTKYRPIPRRQRGR
jgi:hypothetical protein